MLRRGELEAAEGALAGLEGANADRLRDKLAGARRSREEILTEVEALLADPEHHSQRAVQARLKELRATSEDPVAIERVERALSSLADLFAERNASSGKTLVLERQRDEYLEAEAARERAESGPRTDPFVEATITAARTAADASRWSALHTELDRATVDLPAGREVFEALRTELGAGEADDARATLERAATIEGEAGAAAAHDWLATEVARFATERDALDARIAELATRADAERATAALEAEAASLGVSAELAVFALSRSPGELDEAASEAELDGDFARAEMLWRAAAQKQVDALDPAAGGSAGDDDFERDYNARRAAALRAEWRAARTRTWVAHVAERPEALSALGFDELDASGPRIDGEVVPWGRLDEARAEALDAAVGGTRACRLGAIAAALAASDASVRDEALGALAGALDRGWIGLDECTPLVADARGEPPPIGGYRPTEGGWRSERELSEARIGARVEPLVAALRARPSDARDAAYDELRALAEEEIFAFEALGRALEASLRHASRDLHWGKTHEELEGLAAIERELTAAREAALALIFDEDRYFYPYEPPHCSLEQARLYPPVQRAVAGAVERVETLLDDPTRVELDQRYRQAAAELRWLWQRRKGTGTPLAVARELNELPQWLWALPPGAEAITVRDLASGPEAARRLRYNRAVRARNETLWRSLLDRDGAEVPSQAECEQVRITNDYRELLGRAPLAWNPRLQVAAGWHADYMEQTGVFGHEEPENPDRRTYVQRIESAGYAAPRSENCALNVNTPLASHLRWVTSSAHHRNLLDPRSTEIGVARAGAYWVQNYGSDRTFERELDGWQD